MPADEDELLGLLRDDVARFDEAYEDDVGELIELTYPGWFPGR